MSCAAGQTLRQVRLIVVLLKGVGDQRGPPAASARRQRLADIRVTRKRRATSRSLAPPSINSAAASRGRSRWARSAAGQPTTIGMPQVSGIAHAAQAVTRTCNPGS